MRHSGGMNNFAFSLDAITPLYTASSVAVECPTTTMPARTSGALEHASSVFYSALLDVDAHLEHHCGEVRRFIRDCLSVDEHSATALRGSSANPRTPA